MITDIQTLKETEPTGHRIANHCSVPGLSIKCYDPLGIKAYL